MSENAFGILNNHFRLPDKYIHLRTHKLHAKLNMWLY